LRKILVLFFLYCIRLNSQEFSDYRMRYDNFEENDIRAFKFLNPYIQKAKQEKNYRELAQAYKDAVSFSPDRKIGYADSMIWAAAKTKNDDIIGSSYLTKGTLYYFNRKKFKLALDQYMIAWSYLENTKDEYLYYKNLYHIGVVKSYLGYYEEALHIFEKCRIHFNKKKSPSEFPNLEYNNKKGYLNSLHQNIICLIEMSRLHEASLLINEGLFGASSHIDFYIERSYFYKLQGIISFKKKNYDQAISNFNNALAGVEKKNDFTNASAIYFYMGKSLLSKNDVNNAVYYLKKVDSIFSKHQFILPEVRENYEILINHSKKTKDEKMELYFTNQLLKVDHILSTDFRYLSEKIHKEYDTKDLLKAKKRLENSSLYGYGVAAFSLFLLLLIFIFTFFRRRKEREIHQKYKELLLKITQDNADKPLNELVNKPKNSKLSEEMVSDLLNKLNNLEQTDFFLEKGLTQNKLALKLKTNTTYLSEIVNEYKGYHFNTYLNHLRIQYVTKKLYESKMWRSYSIETLAKECGFSNRSNFSKVFTEVNDISPADFIRKREHELKQPSTI
jgi:AraC-like DNA-binding protein